MSADDLVTLNQGISSNSIDAYTVFETQSKKL